MSGANRLRSSFSAPTCRLSCSIPRRAISVFSRDMPAQYPAVTSGSGFRTLGAAYRPPAHNLRQRRPVDESTAEPGHEPPMRRQIIEPNLPAETATLVVRFGTYRLLVQLDENGRSEADHSLETPGRALAQVVHQIVHRRQVGVV